MTNNTPSSAQYRWIPCSIVALVVVFMLLDMMFVAIATHTYSGRYTDNAYQKGLNYDIYNQESANVISNIIIDENQTCFSLAAIQNGKAIIITNATVLAKIGRTVSNKFDQIFELSYNNQAKAYCRNIDYGQGKWQVRIKANYHLDGIDHEIVDHKVVIK